MRAYTRTLFILVLILGMPSAFPAEDRDAKVHQDRKNVTEIGRWIYNDLEKGKVEGRLHGRPLLVVLRCIP